VQQQNGEKVLQESGCVTVVGYNGIRNTLALYVEKFIIGITLRMMTKTPGFGVMIATDG